MRILVTGARNYTKRAKVESEIITLIERRKGKPVVIVHGDCPSGADRFAKEFVQLMDEPWLTDEPHPARWSELGTKAGPIRNVEMVAAGADVCLAFLTKESIGARFTAGRAKKAGIRTVYFS